MQRFEVTRLGKANRSAIRYPNSLFDRLAIGYPNFLFARLVSNWLFWDNDLRIFYTVL